MKKCKSAEYSLQEVALIRAAALRVWNVVAYDCLKGAGMQSMRRAHVVEVVCDANRLEEELRRMNAPADLVAHVSCDDEVEGVVLGAFQDRAYCI